MTRNQLKAKIEVSVELSGIERKLALRVYEQREYLQKLIKLKDYATMHKCNFQRKQLELLKGELNGKNR